MSSSNIPWQTLWLVPLSRRTCAAIYIFGPYSSALQPTPQLPVHRAVSASATCPLFRLILIHPQTAHDHFDLAAVNDVTASQSLSTNHYRPQPCYKLWSKFTTFRWALGGHDRWLLTHRNEARWIRQRRNERRSVGSRVQYEADSVGQ